MKFKQFVFIGSLVLTVHAIKADPSFSLHNKWNQPIVITLWNVDAHGKKKEVASKVRVSAGAFYDSNQPVMNRPSQLEIYNTSKELLYRTSFTVGKTIYVNWGFKKGELKVYPQRGPLKGLMGKTDKGYSTKNNVTDRDILKMYSGVEGLQEYLETESKSLKDQVKGWFK